MWISNFRVFILNEREEFIMMKIGKDWNENQTSFILVSLTAFFTAVLAGLGALFLGTLTWMLIVFIVGLVWNGIVHYAVYILVLENTSTAGMASSNVLFWGLNIYMFLGFAFAGAVICVWQTAVFVAVIVSIIGLIGWAVSVNLLFKKYGREGDTERK